MREFKLVFYRGAFYAAWRESTGTKRRALRTQDRDVAERNFQKFISEQQGPKNTCAEIWAAYCEEKKDAVSAKDFKFRWQKLGPRFGNLRPEQITRALCKVHIAFRRKAGASDNTILREMGNLKSALRWDNKNTPAIFEMPPAGPPRDRALTKAEYKRLLSCANRPHMRLFIILALNTAARSGAILELTWDRVDFEKGMIALSTGEDKRKGRALVRMNDPLEAALHEAYKIRGISGYVIEYGGSQVSSIKKGFKSVVDKAKLEDVSPHILRHTAAVWLAEAGKPMSEIARMLGHKDSRITERVYAKYSPEYMKGVVDALAV